MARRRLDGQKLISQYLRISCNQLRKLYAITVPQEDRLPVFTLTASRAKNVRLSAWTDELDAWVYRRSTRDLYEP